MLSYSHPDETEGVTHAALYACVSTDLQDHGLQIHRIKEFVVKKYLDAGIEKITDIISGTEEGGAEYHRFREAIADGEIDVVVVHELSGLSRLGGGDIHNLLNHTFEHKTSVSIVTASQSRRLSGTGRRSTTRDSARSFPRGSSTRS